ncbi:MAG: hypothetical protein ISS71_00220 [Phycisphaerae bacterium]|nr:hypothetical protein [Phycisphaerae bacterium]
MDTTKYIFLDEIQADMEAYCLTVFSGTQVERFGLKVLSVVRGYRPGQNMILVIGTDERFQHAGTIHGCSGSPVFIDGRLAGALAAGWDGSLDALYMVRPIEDMLEVGSVESPPDTTSEAVFHFDLSGPMNLADVYRQSMDQLQNCAGEQGMLIPLSSSLPSQVCDSFRVPLHQMGFIPVSAPATLPTVSEATDFERGGVLSVVLCGGDISLAATGTVTDILGDQIYGFGHNFKGQGPTNLPITAGVVHAVVAGRNSSFKFSSPGPVLGTLQFDQSFGVRGTIGVAPKTIPLTIRVHRENAPESRTYNCYLASDRMYTPLILQLALNGAALLQGPLPPEHTVRYESQVKIKGQEPLILKNISSGQSTSDIEQNLYSIAALALNNPFKELELESIDATVEITSGDGSAGIRAVDVSGTRVRPGQTISISVTLISFRSEESATVIEFKIPETLSSGKYTIQVMGGSNYRRFVANLAPQRFRAFDAETLMEALRRVTGFRNDGLYAVMPIPATGIVLQQHELPQLPQTKMLLMQDDKRLRPVTAYQDWTESRIDLDKIVQGGAEIEIMVE